MLVSGIRDLKCLLKERVHQMNEKREYGQGDIRYSWFINRMCVRELTMFSSPLRLAMMLMVFALKNSNQQAAPQLHLVDFSTPCFSYFTEKHEILSREKIMTHLEMWLFYRSRAKNPMRQKFVAIAHVARCKSYFWLFVVHIVIEICFSYHIHQSL